MFKVMNKPEPFLWIGAILTIVGLAGTGISAYYVATKPNNDHNSTAKTIGLVSSIVLLLIGIVLMVYYYKGYLLDSTGQCPLEQMAENIQYQPQGVPDIPPPLPSNQASPMNVNITMNQPPQKPV